DGGDMNRCEFFKYMIDVKALNIKYKEPIDLVIIVGLKGQARPVSYVYKSKDAKVQLVETGEGALINFQQVLYSSEPPILNFSESGQYTGPLWNRQYIKVGDYTIFPSTWLLAGFFRKNPDVVEWFAKLANFRSKYIISCGKDGLNPGEYTTVDVANGGTQRVTLCNGNIEITVGANADYPHVTGGRRALVKKEVSDQFYNCYGIKYELFSNVGEELYGYSIDSNTLGSNPELGKICCIQIKADKGNRKTEYGEFVTISFYVLGHDDDGDGQLSNDEKNFDIFEERCSGNNWYQDEYCINRALGTQTLYADIGQTTYSMVPRGC
ncbi:MAG: hypothetical protein V1870_00395, partial [Candidatus Aenigmatarchaeota archaeon]